MPERRLFRKGVQALLSSVQMIWVLVLWVKSNAMKGTASYLRYENRIAQKRMKISELIFMTLHSQFGLIV